MAYEHGVSTIESSSFQPPQISTEGMPVVIGVAPINQVPAEKRAINKPILVKTYDEAVAHFGYDSDFNNYTISEAIKAQFLLYEHAPIVLINVLDPATHKTTGVPETLAVTAGQATLKKTGVLPETVIVKSADSQTTYPSTDYELEFDEKGHLNIFIDVATSISVAFDVINPAAVTPSDIIGGVTEEGELKGLELINHVFPLYRIVPGTILAPKYSTNPTVAAVISTKASKINGLFKAIALVDIPTDSVTSYTDVSTYKEDNNITSTNQVALWPKVSYAGEQFHLSTHLAGLFNRVDAQNDYLPHVSPSNKELKVDGAVLASGKAVTLGQEQAAYLNGEGIATALNFVGGWKFWGNRTAAYPKILDPKDSFISVRRMMNYIQNKLILDYWAKVDSPTNTKLVESVLNDVNIWLNGLSARGQIIGGRVEFLEQDNPQSALLDGVIKFRVNVAPPIPARKIEFLVEFDVTYFETLFAA